MSSVSSINSLLSSGSTSSNSIDLSSILSAATGATSTGIDVTSAVDAAIYAARAPERQWQTQQATAQAQVSTLGSIQTALASVISDLKSLGDPLGSVTARTAVSSNTGALTATATANATSGSHTMTIQQLATPTAWYSAALPSAGSQLGSSTLQIATADGTVHNFALAGSGAGSLSELASTINGATLGIRASVVTDSTGARLALVSSSTGSSTDFSVTDGVSSGATWTSATVATGTQLSSGTLTVGDGNSTQAIAIQSGDTLQSLADRVNSSGLALSASVVTDSQGSHLSVTASDASTGVVSVSSDPTLTLVKSNTGTDAKLAVDGIPITSSTNTVSGVIAGITLNLQGSTAGSQVNLQVTPDSTKIANALGQFVQDYNSAVQLVNQQFTYSTSSTAQGQLGSSSDIRSLQSALLGIASYAATSNGATGTATLASLGISMNDDGTLSLDETALNQALATNPDSIQSVLQGTALNGFASTAATALDPFGNAASGLLTIASGKLTKQVSDLQSRINDFESGYIASQQTMLTSMYSKAEIALQQLPATLKQIQAQLGSNSGS